MPGRGGFTLLELLLVVAIMLIAAGLSIPSFMRSYRGAALRTSARAVVMSHRYARAMAVLKQTDVAILFDSKKNTMEIVSVTSASEDDRNMFLDARDGQTGVQQVDDQAAPAAAGPVSTEHVRALEQGVRIGRFESPKVVREKDGLYWVRYYSSGMCDEYSVELVDEYNKSATVKVDSISGKAKVEYD